jgi:sec-independent protein translocase protein TatA
LTHPASLFPLALFQNLGLAEMLIIGFVVLLVFGGRLPNLARSLGQSLVQFKKGLRDDESPAKGPTPPTGDSNGTNR